MSVTAIAACDPNRKIGTRDNVEIIRALVQGGHQFETIAHQCSMSSTSEPHHIEAYAWWIAVSVGGSQTIGIVAPAAAAYDTLAG